MRVPASIAVVLLAVLSSLAAGGSAAPDGHSKVRADPFPVLKDTETVVVPGRRHVHHGVLAETDFYESVRYRVRISGSVDISPRASREIDAIYCFQSAVGTPCQPKPYAVGGVQLTWFSGREVLGWQSFLYPRDTPPYTESHVYTGMVVPPDTGPDALEFSRLRIGVSGYDTDPTDNVGQFIVLISPPPACEKPWVTGGRRALRVTIGKESCPDIAGNPDVAAGGSITFCNRSSSTMNLRRAGFAQAAFLPLKTSTLLRPGKCLRLVVQNPTRKAAFFAVKVRTYPGDARYLSMGFEVLPKPR